MRNFAKFFTCVILLMTFTNSYSQIKIDLKKQTKFSIKDTLEIQVDLTELSETFSDEEIFGNNGNELEIILELNKATGRKITQNYEESKNQDNYQIKEVYIDFKERLINNIGSSTLKLIKKSSNKYIYYYKSPSSTAELFQVQSPEYFEETSWSISFNNSGVNSDNFYIQTSDSESINLKDGEFDIMPFDQTVAPYNQLMYYSENVKNNLTELINDINKDLIYDDQRFYQGQTPRFLQYKDFDNDGETELLARIYDYVLGYEYDRILSNDEKDRLVSRIALFEKENVNDSIVYSLKWKYDEKSEGTDVHAIDLDNDNDFDIITKPDVFHGTVINRPKYYNDSFHRPNSLYINDGNGGFTVDSLSVNINPNNLLQADNDDLLELIYSDLDITGKNPKLIIKENVNSEYISDGVYDFSSLYDETIGGIRNIDFNNDGNQDLLFFGSSTDYNGEPYDSTQDDIRKYSLSVSLSKNGKIKPELDNISVVSTFETPFMIGWEGDPIDIIDFNGEKLIILWLIRNGRYYGTVAEGVPASMLKAFKINNGELKDVTNTVFPNNIHESYYSLGNPPLFTDVNNDGRTDIVFNMGSWTLTDENNYSVPVFLNMGDYFEPRYLANFHDYTGFEMFDIDGDNSLEGYNALRFVHKYGLKNELEDIYSWYNLVFDDKDLDGIEDSKDNCPNKYNPNQEDSDGDGFGDVCDNYEDTFSIESSEIIEDVVIVSSEFQQLVDNEGYNNYNRNYFGTNNSYDYKDFNGDGFKDLIIVSNYQPEIGNIAGVFLWNDENKKFEDLTSHIMINRGDVYFHGKTVYDFDEDGDLDVYIPTHNYHGEEGKQPDYYFEGGQRFPGHYFINEGDKFYRKMIDSVVVDHGDRKDYPAFDQAFIIDLNNNGKKDLISVVMNSGYPGGEANYFFNKYSIDQSKNISKEFIFPWNEDYRYDGQAHSLLVKEDDKNIYVYTQPKELWINNGPYSYPEVWIYKKDGKFDSKDPQKIKLKRNKNLRNAGSIINRETFYVEDLDGDGNQEIIIGMFEEPFENGEHASLHVFNLNGNEITDTWFNEREFIDTTGSAHNGFVVKDFNNDGFSDLVVNARFNSDDKEIPLFMNTGKKFKKFNINKVKDGWHMPVDIDNDSIYEFLTFNSKDDPADISSLVKINYSGFDSDNDDDGIVNSLDNCPDTSNPDQKDTDGDGIGDVCDDSDGDGVLDLDDQCPFTNPDETVNENGCSETELNIDNSSGLVVANNQIGKKFLTDLYSFEIQEGNCPSTEDDIANGDCFNCSVRYFIWEDNYIIFDYNNDGNDDLFAFLINAGEDGIFQSDENPTGKLMFYDNYLSGSTEPQYFESEIVWGGWLDVNDFNGDGFYDILVTANNSHEVSKVTNEQFENIPFEIFFFDSNGFSERKVLDMENASSNGPMSGDIDKDGDIDIIQPKIKTDEDKRSYVLVNDGNGNFSQNFKFLTEIENKQERLEMSDHGQILYDINKDGCLDWIVPVMNNGKFVIEDGKLIEKEIDGGGPTEYDDLIYVNGEYVKSGSRILWGDCSGNYSFENSYYFDQHQDYLLSELSKYNLESLYGALSYNVFDYNNDGVNDIILSKNYGNRATGLQLFKGSSDGSYTDVTLDTFDKFFFKNSGSNGETIDGDFPRIWNIAVKDKDGDGDLDLIPWGMSSFQDRCWKDLLSGEEYWEFVNGKFYFRSDKDLDGVYDHLDNCPETANEDQADTDGDGMGDVCDNDIDGDGILNDSDNCFETANEDQSDIDGDGIGDVCDDDIDGDGILNDSDNCPETVNEDQADMDGDGIGDVCDDDKDGDTILNTDDNCPETANEDQADIDGDGLGDVCDDDKDGDTILNVDDNCPETANEDQADMDSDGVGDGCDDDIDGDGILNADDNCPETPLNITVDVNGCEVFDLPLNNNKVSVISASCIGNTDGSIGISVEDDSYNYTVTVTGQDDPISLGAETKTASVTGLGTGTYTVCFKVDGQDAYEQCFEVNIAEPKALSAFIDVDNDNKTTSIQLSGSSSYNVEVNGQRFDVKGDRFTTNLPTGLSIIKISTDLDCQGIIEREIFISEDIHYYPNPTQTDVNVHVSGEDTMVQVSVFSEKGDLIYTREQQIQDFSRKTNIDLSRQITGTYIVVMDGPTVRKTFKIVKK